MPRRTPTVSFVALALAASATLASGVAPAGASVGSSDVLVADLHPDFNGDGINDLAVGARGENLGADNQGAVNVIYGSASGLTAIDNQFWSQDAPSVLGTGEAQDTFGAAVGFGDFNGDGFDDLAVGVPGDVAGGKHNAGAVNVIYGSAQGLSATGNQLWNQDSTGIDGDPRAYDFFGNALVARDFDGDGYGDLAIGAFGDGSDGFPRDCGSVQVLYGTATGLSTDRTQQLHQMKGKAKRFDWFGAALASGDFDHDGFPDLVIGAPYDPHSGSDQAGEVNVVYGSATGFKAARNQLWDEGQPGVPGDPDFNQHLGASLSVVDFNGDSYSDLAIGIEQDTVGGVSGAGSALVLYGSATGLSSNGSQQWSQDSAGIADFSEPNDDVGDVVGGDFNRDGYADLAIGFNHEDINGVQDAGAVNVIYGTPSGLSSTGNQFWNQDVTDVQEVAETTDWFGESLTRGDFDDDGYFDLVIGVPGETVSPGVGGGSINVLYGSSVGLTTADNAVWNQDSPGILDFTENPDFFGLTLMDR